MSPSTRREARPSEYSHGFPNTELGMGHWNRLGHVLAAMALAPEVCRLAGAERAPDPPVRP